MAVENDAMLIRRELLTRISRLLMQGQLRRKVDRIPLELRPKGAPTSRCCVYKDRAMIKYKIMALLGFSIQDEQDELIPLSEYAEHAFERDRISPRPLTVVDEVCSACVKVSYVVTNMCRGCLARPCTINCPKNAVEFRDGQAHIDHQKCVNCGMCKKNCPFHAIVYVPIPCEESCPVGAISKDEDGHERIDFDKCIYCGRCVSSCPFGAVMEKSQLIDIFKALQEKTEQKKVVAMVAPAIAGQFRAPLGNILGAIRQLGFDDVIEVAKGADTTTRNEAAEFLHKMEEGQKFMTTSCCPSYTALVNKHIPELRPYVSDTRTPMGYTAELARKMYPEAVLVFIGPCLAKRHETYMDANADLMLSFEELDAMFVAAGIDIVNMTGVKLDDEIDSTSRGYPVSSGVMTAVRSRLPEGTDLRPLVINGIDKQAIREMKGFPKACAANMIEVMACEGGCVGGCNTIANSKVAARQIGVIAKK